MSQLFSEGTQERPRKWNIEKIGCQKWAKWRHLLLMHRLREKESSNPHINPRIIITREVAVPGSFSKTFNRGNITLFFRALLFLLFFGYIGGVFLLYYHLQAPVVLTSLVLLLNFICLYFFGNYMLRGILFPYANKYIRRQLDSAINKRFSTEFSRLIMLMAHMVKILAEVDTIESYHDAKEEVNYDGDPGAAAAQQ